MRIKDEYIDMWYSCPFTGIMTYMRTLRKEMYPHWYNKLPELFEDVCPTRKKIYYKNDSTGE